jgi:cell division protease FtsH
MVLESYLPINFELPNGDKTKTVIFSGSNWQIIKTQNNCNVLIAYEELFNKWISSGLLELSSLSIFNFGEQKYGSISSPNKFQLTPVTESDTPEDKVDAMAFSMAIKVSRAIDQTSPFQDAVYIEQLSRLLPTYSLSSETGDDKVLGYWLSGGANVSVESFRQINQLTSWMKKSDLRDVIEASGHDVHELTLNKTNKTKVDNKEVVKGKRKDTEGSDTNETKQFSLPGRPELESFFNEHIVDIILNSERYKSLGIEFPSSIALHGPPGCGKTFAVEKLVEFLGWPSFDIDASSVASPYIHETSKKVAEVFDKAIENSPSVLIIDEMESFLADREMGSGHHRVEEVAEFLRRIPEAAKNNVLIIAMTNRIDIIDPAILRRGRFDHVIEVGYASELEIKSLLNNLLKNIPKAEELDVSPFAKKLSGRPLSDVTFVVREGARLAAKSGKDTLDIESLHQALEQSPSRVKEDKKRRIGFI